MLLRQGSLSSSGSVNARPAELQRNGSSGSMAERTFRQPSPNRGNMSIMPPDDAPPVPKLPREYTSPPHSAKMIRRPVSVEPPQRVGSPNQPLAGRGVSLDRGPGMLPLKPDRRTKQQVKKVNYVGESNDPQGRDLVNFSRPMSPPNSPPTSPTNTQFQTSFHDPSASVTRAPAARALAISDNDAENIHYEIYEAANRPVKKKKKLGAKGNAEGSHFPKSVLPAVASSAVNSHNAPRSYSPRQLLLDTNLQDSGTEGVQPKEKKSIAAIDEGRRLSYGSDSETQSEQGSSSDRPRTFHTRAARLLAKQPSVVREDRAAEEKEEQITLRRSAEKLSKNGGAATNYKTASDDHGIYQHHGEAASEPMVSSISPSASSVKASMGNTKQTLEDKRVANRPPLSPARAAHFSNQLVLQTPDQMKHQPPSRSVSPAKSALKHSPSSRGHSPLGALPGSWTGRNGRAASEASDTTSAVSEEGVRNTRKRKSVKVSFDEDSVIVGRAASPPTSPDSPIIMSPQEKRANGGWSVHSRGKREDVPASDPEIGSIMQPTPTLPSFGSIREKNKQSPAHAGRTTIAQDTSKTVPSPIESSTDQIIGRIFAQDSERKAQTSVPSTLPVHNDDAGVTSGSSHLDSTAALPDTSASSLGASVPDRSLSLDTSSATAPMETYDSMSESAVPSIAILPATPGLEDRSQAQSDWMDMPGGFPPSTDSLHNGQITTIPTLEHHPSVPTPAQAGIAEPEPRPTASGHEAGVPTVEHLGEAFRTQMHSQAAEDSEDGESSIYSDAAEDLSDLEGDGFGSINAIVDSPARAQPSVLNSISASSVSAETPVDRSLNLSPTTGSGLRRTESQLPEPGSEEDWGRAQEYWSGLSPIRKAQLERAAAPGAVDELPNETNRTGAEANPPPKKKAFQDKPAQSPVSEHPPLPPWPDKQSRKEMAKVKPPSTFAKKQSMRGLEPEGLGDVRMQSRIGNRGLEASRNSAQSPEAPQARGALRKKSRPASAATTDDYDRSTTGRLVSHSRAASAGQAPKYVAAMPTSPSGLKLHRINSNASDSSSSFKKSRPRAAVNGRYTMKRSMRGGSIDDRPQSMNGIRNGSVNNRSLSPTGPNARRPFSSAGPSMRTSLRGSIDANIESRTKSPSRFGFGKAAKSQPKKAANSKWPSRFADSSDEEDVGRVGSSRFMESSDDEDMTPVRGIPRQIDEGDSTELEDSPVEATPPSKSMPKILPDATQKVENAAMVGSVHSPYDPVSGALAGKTGSQARIWAEKEKKKRSFFGGLGKKGRNDSRVRKLDLDSPARRDTPLERPRAERLFSNGAGSDRPSAAAAAVAPASPKSPKLQRRTTPKRFASDSWPLPETALKGTEADVRPNTSDGNGLAVVTEGDVAANGSARPDLGGRRSTDPPEAKSRPGAYGIGMPATGGKGPKKKRFPMLRKALGLHD